MKITKVELKNFQGNHALSLDFPNKPVVLVAGHNWSGKSTILDAIRYALIGRTAKTGVERPATDNSLITDAHLTVPPDEGGTVRIEGLDGMHPFMYTRSLKTGSLSGARPSENTNLGNRGAVPALFSGYFSSLSPEQRRVLLWKCSEGGEELDVGDFRDALLDDEIVLNSPEATDVITQCAKEIESNYRAGGFDAAHKEATMARQLAKGEWKGVTGETWGVHKAVQWLNRNNDGDPDETDPEAREQHLAGQIAQRRKFLEAKKQTIEKTTSALERLRQEEKTHDAYHDAMVERANDLDEIGKLAKQGRELVEKGESLGRLLEKLEWQMRVDTLARQPVECPNCRARLRVRAGPDNKPALVMQSDHQLLTPTQIEKLQRNILELRERRGKMGQQLAMIQHKEDVLQRKVRDNPMGDEPRMVGGDEVDEMEAKLSALKAEYEELNSELHRWVKDHEGIDDEQERRALNAHLRVKAWDKACVVTGPGPKGLLASRTRLSLAKLNDDVAQFGKLLHQLWPNPMLDENLASFAYDAMSVSERWLVDLAVSQSLGRGHSRILLLDELDVISPEARPAIFSALARLVSAGYYTQIVVCCTLRRAPSLPEKGPLGLVWLPKMNEPPVRNLLMQARYGSETPRRAGRDGKHKKNAVPERTA